MHMYRRYGDITWEATDAPGAGPAILTPRRPALRRRGRRAEPPPAEALPAIHLHGIRLHAINEMQCVEHILEELDAKRGGMVVTPNLDHIRRATRDMNFGALVAEADLVVAD